MSYGMLSSTYLAMSRSLIKRNKSHKNMLNKSCSKIDHCGTSKSKSVQELKGLSILTL